MKETPKIGDIRIRDGIEHKIVSVTPIYTPYKHNKRGSITNHEGYAIGLALANKVSK